MLILRINDKGKRGALIIMGFVFNSFSLNLGSPFY